MPTPVGIRQNHSLIKLILNVTNFLFMRHCSAKFNAICFSGLKIMVETEFDL